jgi:hypothetical protein
MRHIYRIHFINGKTEDKYSKKELTVFLKTIDRTTIEKIEWYKSNGFWVDMTEQYI